MTYKQSWIVHGICWTSMIVFGGGGLLTIFSAGKGGGTWPGLVLIMIATIAAWLYLRSGFLQWSVEETGLSIRRPFGVQFVPWSEIRSIKWLPGPKTIQIKSAKNVICFISADGFPQLGGLIAEVARRSNCEIPSGLQKKLRIE